MPAVAVEERGSAPLVPRDSPFVIGEAAHPTGGTLWLLPRQAYRSRIVVATARECWKPRRALVWVGMAVRKQAAVVGMVAATLTLVQPVLARETSPSLERALWTGASPGRPSDAKRVVLTGLYVLSAASLGATGYFVYTWVESSKELGASDSRGVCFELASRACREFTDAQADVRSAQRYTAASAAAAAGFLLSGVLVAQYWDNVSLGFGVSPSATSVQFTHEF